MSLTAYNQENHKKLHREIEAYGVAAVARKYGVNHYYISKMNADPDYIPRNEDILTALGYKTYKVSVPRGAPRKQYDRAIVHRTTRPEKIKADLKRVTGVDWVPLEDTLEY